MRILKVPEPSLREKVEDEIIDPQSVGEWSEEMIDLVKGKDALGLSAPQVGIRNRFFVMKSRDGFITVINPQILSKKGRQTQVEGCLSMPDERCIVQRPTKIRVEYTTLKGEEVERVFRNKQASIFSHEYDHLNGVLIDERSR